MKTEDGYLDYMVKFETKGECLFYGNTIDDLTSTRLNEWLKEAVGVEDTDVFYYLMPDEQEPAVGGTFVLDDIKYERVA